MNEDKELREHLLELLESRGAHVNFEEVVKDFPVELRGKRIKGLNTAWQILEHMRICQKDIIEFMRSSEYEELDYPGDYWPKEEAPKSPEDWDNSVKSFLEDLESIKSMVRGLNIDLYAKIPHGSGQTILREILLVADHNAYHIGQLVQLRLLLGLEVLY